MLGKTLVFTGGNYFLFSLLDSL